MILLGLQEAAERPHQDGYFQGIPGPASNDGNAAASESDRSDASSMVSDTSCDSGPLTFAYDDDMWEFYEPSESLEKLAAETLDGSPLQSRFLSEDEFIKFRDWNVQRLEQVRSGKAQSPLNDTFGPFTWKLEARAKGNRARYRYYDMTLGVTFEDGRHAEMQARIISHRQVKLESRGTPSRASSRKLRSHARGSGLSPNLTQVVGAGWGVDGLGRAPSASNNFMQRCASQAGSLVHL
eukprot:gb/GFBE01000296.1/.p1 GENE.gb/GFBE01000296.1/~~gb/GFBE01000296.1/.p1  ORF type:complete len:238 (+),score=27.62 gb/GFBE01000296.1/:1-714(+)